MIPEKRVKGLEGSDFVQEFGQPLARDFPVPLPGIITNFTGFNYQLNESIFHNLQRKMPLKNALSPY